MYYVIFNGLSITFENIK